MTFINPEIESSYQRSAMGKILYDAVLSIGARKIIDFGLLNGYSTVCFAMAAKITGGTVYGYDIFEDYKYNNSNRDIVLSNLKRYNLDNYVKLSKIDFNDWVNGLEDFDILHVDISNDGDTIKKLYDATRGMRNCRIFFEGGSKQRDESDWMVTYNKQPIHTLEEKYKILSWDSYEHMGRIFYPCISELKM